MSLPKLRGINGNVLIEPISEEITQTKAGIYAVPTGTANRGRLKKGRVVLVEEGEKISKDEIVYYANGAGNEVLFDSRSFLLIPILQLKLVEGRD